MWDADRDARLRETTAWLTVRTHDGAQPISTHESSDFVFDGERHRLMDAQRGIWKPAALESALSMRTVYRKPGKPRPHRPRWARPLHVAG